MTKFTISLCTLLLLCSCSQEPQYPAEKALDEIKALNAVLVGNANTAEVFWPYSEPYLKARHTIYSRVNIDSLNDAQLQTLNYLTIEERFVRRYQPWHLLFDLSPLLTRLGEPQWQSELASWLTFVEYKMMEAQRSKIFINQIELAHINNQLSVLSDSPMRKELTSSVQSLQKYLATYVPRNQLGLSQLPNGGDWLQTKLNYYSNDVHSPIQWLTAIQSQLKSYESELVAALPEPRTNELASDLDWRQGFADLKGWAKLQNLSSEQKKMALIWMELDLGVHAQMWDEELVFNLMAQRGIAQPIAQQLLDKVLRNPGQSFIYAFIVREI
ncbi:hypothetical protein AAEU32_00705 [Pseudoalteromonas sp. SSDWG2]|uniref:hypothetical protein n=1 Tax=Pseudoalteromonas sp. SSDWG2 TaxID=3139391 RepID=UPI003BAA7BEB